MTGQLQEMKARADELGHINTRDLASKLVNYGVEYKLLANFEADHRRLIAALEAVEGGLAGLDDIFTEEGEDDQAIRAITSRLRDLIAGALA